MSHPGYVQCRSRSHSRLTWAAVNSRTSMPRSTTAPATPSTVGMIVASQASRRTVSGASRVPASGPAHVTPAPRSPLRSVSRSTVTNSWLLVCRGPLSAAATARRTSVTSASPRRRSLERRSRSPSTGRGADNGPNAASSTALPSGSRVSRYSATPISSTHGCDSATYRFAASCSRCS